MKGAASPHGLIRLQHALPRVGSFAAFAVAAGVIALAAGIKILFDHLASAPLPQYITFYPAVVIASLCAGPRIGLITAALTLLIAWFAWIPDYFSFAIGNDTAALTIATYAFTSALLAVIVGMARLALDYAAESEAERGVAARESVHRIKNLIAVVQALAQKIAREVSSTEDFRALLSQRLAALDRAQNMLVREERSDLELGAVIDGALAPFLPNPGLKLQRGPEVTVPARYVSGLSLALYELCTNAMKYGALAEGRGPVMLTWRCEQGACVLEWREGREQKLVEGSGFGTMLIKMALSRDPNTRVDYEFTPTEVVAVFSWPTPQKS